MLVELKNKKLSKINCLNDEMFHLYKPGSILPITYEIVEIGKQNVFLVIKTEDLFYAKRHPGEDVFYYKILIDNQGLFWANSSYFKNID